MAALSLFSCATSKSKAGRFPVRVTNSRVAHLLPPSAASSPVDSYFALSAAFGGKSLFAQAVVQIDGENLFLALFNDFGADIGGLLYDGDSLVFKSMVFPPALKGQYIAFDIQAAFYDAAALKESLAGAGLAFRAFSVDGGERREIRSGAKLIEEIEIKDGNVRIENRLRGYEYTLEALDR